MRRWLSRRLDTDEATDNESTNWTKRFSNESIKFETVGIELVGMLAVEALDGRPPFSLAKLDETHEHMLKQWRRGLNVIGGETHIQISGMTVASIENTQFRNH